MSPTNLNLDDMFSFLKDDKLDVDRQTQDALDQINTEFTLLNQLLDEDMVGDWTSASVKWLTSLTSTN